MSEVFSSALSPQWLKVSMPCCEDKGGSKHSVRVKPLQDRRCPHCKCWWRVDVKLVRRTVEASVHRVEWTRIGRLS